MYNHSIDDIYIGSTILQLSQRMSMHRRRALKELDRKSKIYVLMRSTGIKNWKIKLIEKFPCNCKNDLNFREEFWRIKLKAKLNTFRCYTGISGGLNKNEYRRRYNNKYYSRPRKMETNNPWLRESDKQVQCYCNKIIKKKYLKQHLKTKYHIKCIPNPPQLPESFKIPAPPRISDSELI